MNDPPLFSQCTRQHRIVCVCWTKHKVFEPLRGSAGKPAVASARASCTEHILRGVAKLVHSHSLNVTFTRSPLSLSLTHTLPLSESGNGWVSALLLLVSKTECTLNMNANELSNKTWKLQNLKTSIKVRPRGCEMWGGGDNRGRKLSNSMGNCDFNCTSSLVGLR